MYLSKDFTGMYPSNTNEDIEVNENTRKLYINEKSIALHNGTALATQYCSEENTSAYISVEDIIDTLQTEANRIAGNLMVDEMKGESEMDRRYNIGKWEKLNELITVFKANGN